MTEPANHLEARCDLGLLGWQGKLRNNYLDFPEFVVDCDKYRVHRHLGYTTPAAAWMDNPVVGTGNRGRRTIPLLNPNPRPAISVSFPPAAPALLVVGLLADQTMAGTSVKRTALLRPLKGPS
jgi:hypothetical protein